MTEQEILNSFQFKLIRKMLRKEFKWIKDLELDGDPNRYDSTIFLQIVMDPFQCAEEEGLTVAMYVHKNTPMDCGTLSVFFNESYENPLIVNIKDEIKDIVYDGNRNVSIPEDLKLPNKKVFSVGNFRNNS
jgi:hypothetical protein